ncbi:phosphoglycerate mutase-like protein AT74 [Nymphaea colorata]|nr:phosphoglycerate mutase-like protein AT74 [Nymphaea colorata]
MGSNRILPKRIILVRHGESQGNLDNAAYTTTADHRIPLTAAGVRQAREAGAEIRRIVAWSEEDWRVYFYVSPYARTRATLSEIGRSFSRREIAGVREECRIREQDFGNFQEEKKMQADKKKRQRFGRFFFRFPEGESAADVYDRVTSFLESLWRDIDMNRINRCGISNFNIVIVSHGVTSRVFLMKWFRWTVEQFERLHNLTNCQVRVMQLGAGGEYSLAIHHSDEEMKGWGLSQEMITDQKMRATAKKSDWIDDCPWHLNDFFQHLRESDEADCLEEDQQDSLNLIGDRSIDCS